MNKANNKSPEMIHEGNNTVKLNDNDGVLESAAIEEFSGNPPSGVVVGPDLGSSVMFGAANSRLNSSLQRSLCLQHFAI